MQAKNNVRIGDSWSSNNSSICFEDHSALVSVKLNLVGSLEQSTPSGRHETVRKWFCFQHLYFFFCFSISQKMIPVSTSNLCLLCLASVFFFGWHLCTIYSFDFVWWSLKPLASTSFDAIKWTSFFLFGL